MKIISMGWGVQSWTLAAMSALGELPPIDYCVHADTTWEHEHTYTMAATWGPWLKSFGIKYITVSDRAQAQAVGTMKTDIPAFTVYGPNSTRGQLHRQCTGRWKIQPIRQWTAAELSRQGLSKSKGVVEQWLGITTDEWLRAKDSDVAYIKHRFPLLDLKMSRADCITWLNAHGLPVPAKSACVFCPYHNTNAWSALKNAGGSDWDRAIAVDEAIRNVRPPYPLFVHSSRIPLRNAVAIPKDYGAEQLNLFDTNLIPCDSGYCFL